MIHRVNSDEKRIQKAYRTILLKNHPDKGGSPYLAAKVNQAKDMLLEGSTTGSHLHVCLKHSIVQSLTLQSNYRSQNPITFTVINCSASFSPSIEVAESGSEVAWMYFGHEI